jgi:hypothetical protein
MMQGSTRQPSMYCSHACNYIKLSKWGRKLCATMQVSPGVAVHEPLNFRLRPQPCCCCQQCWPAHQACAPRHQQRGLLGALRVHC